ncbi:hypothetical protein [Sphingobium ummariense]|uniref:Lipoprotein n=1 Tax=Sphingobium ummariense RL-3 TaxID=1346791 RepID=T0J428_9SPHN|nr:hypothetical protein [Sphingobium ummariense]EQB31597.1 hypothetical protein M529_13755 [Sphingobium ummariense RL-3]
MGGRESFLFSVLLLVACAQKAPSAAGDAAVSPNRDAPAEMAGVMAPPGDPEEAIRSEFAHVERRGTAEAYALFAERHPGHPLAKEAARRAAALRRGNP